jgi:hypothetical protein
MEATNSNLPIGIANAASAAVVRRITTRYAHKVGDQLAEELRVYFDNNSDVTDLADEIAILRLQVGNNLAEYERVNSWPLSAFGEQLTPYQQTMARTAFLEGILAKLNASIEQVREYALTMSKIQASRNGKLDFIMAQQLAASVAQQVDEMILEGRREAVGDYIANAFNGFNPHGPVISSQPAKESAAEIVRAMAMSVPYCEPRAEVVADVEGKLPVPVATTAPAGIVPFSVPNAG